MLFNSSPFQKSLAIVKTNALALLKGTVVYYDNGTDDPFPVPARIGATTFRVDTGQQFNTRIRTVDFLIDASDLHPPDGDTFEPAEGHRLRLPTSDETYDVHECLPIGEEPGWRFSDTSQAEYRIHTKRLKGTA